MAALLGSCQLQLTENLPDQEVLLDFGSCRPFRVPLSRRVASGAASVPLLPGDFLLLPSEVTVHGAVSVACSEAAAREPGGTAERFIN